MALTERTLFPAPENFAVIRHITVNLLKRHPIKQSLKRKTGFAPLSTMPCCWNSFLPI